MNRPSTLLAQDSTPARPSIPRRRAKARQQPTPPPDIPQRSARAATFRLLLDTAMAMIQQGGLAPSVAQVAAQARVSRATAYRYFSTRSSLISAVIGASLGPVRTFASDTASGRERVRELFMQTFPRFKEFEPQLRAAAQLALEQSALERAGVLQEEPYRRGHRINILAHALEPLAATMAEPVRDKLQRALSVIYGIEPYVILKDIWGLPDKDVERIALWMAEALVDAALREGQGTTEAPTDAAAIARSGPQPLGSPAWHDQQYNSRGRIPEHLQILQLWSESSTRARAALRCVLDQPYGEAASEKLDIFLPQRRGVSAPPAPVLVYLHGGYWRALDKRDQSFVATPFVQAGALVVLPNYALAPAVSIQHIVMQMVQALAWVRRNIAAHGGDPDRVVVAGHSAGGHLASLLLLCDWSAVAPDLPAHWLQAALSISGLYDLEPLRHAPFLAPDLALDRLQALALSPARMRAPQQGRLVAVVGAHESEEFHRQHALIAQTWGPRAVPVWETVPGRHHMDVLHALAEPGSRVHAHALALLGLGAPVLDSG